MPEPPLLAQSTPRAWSWAPRRGQVVWAVLFAAAVAVTAWSHLEQWKAEPVLAVAYSLIGLGWLGTAWLLWHQPEQNSNARMFLLVAGVWIVGEVARKNIEVLYQPTLFVAQYTQILASSIMLRYPRRRFDPYGRIYFLSGVVMATVFAVPFVLLAPGPGQPGDAPGLIVDSLGPYRFGDVEAARSVYWLVYSVLFVTLFVAHWRRLTKFERRTLTPILVSAIAVAIAIGAAAFEPMMADAALRAGRLARGLTGVGVSVAFVASARRLRTARASVADLVERLSGQVSERSVQSALVAVFEDPSIEVLPWQSGVDDHAARGRLVMPVPGSDGKPLAVAVFPPELHRHKSLLESHLAACGLALENSRQLKLVHEARTRLVQAGLEERRRLERDLHDGAQQRLLALGMQLGALEAEADTPATAQALRRLREELRQAQQELRDLAHGIYPTVLTQAGLGPALESVVERLDAPFTLSVPTRRWDQDIENAVYLVACEAIANVVKHAGPCQTHIEIREAPGHLELLVADDGSGFPQDDDAIGPSDRTRLGTVTDRLAALGGSVAIESLPGKGTTVRAQVPLPSL